MYVILGLLLLSNAVTPCITVYSAKKWRKRVERRLAAARKKHLAEIDRIRSSLEVERTLAKDAHVESLVVKHEIGIDSRALQLACMEIVCFEDEEGNLLFGGDWQEARRYIRKSAQEHHAEVDEDALKKVYRVKIDDQR